MTRQMGRFLVSFLIFSGMIFSIAWGGEIRYDRGNRRDPFIPLMGPGAVGRGGVSENALFPIEGIIYDPKKDSYAVVGGQIYREGESINGAKIIKILSDRVVFLQESEEVVIWLREEIIPGGPKKSGEKQ
ncbi:MAG: hypothetical protein HY447_04525 [Candidatus Omnitrophica bacterium]|nr:hypothetical protein [Candidatus Omnitrophota bacterium]